MSIVSSVMRPCLILLYVCFVIRKINYCCSCLYYTATLYIELGPIFCMHASAAGVYACLGKREQQNDQDNSAGRANWSLLAERCLKSYCSVVSLFFRHIEELFRNSAAERRRCCSTRTINSTIPGVRKVSTRASGSSRANTTAGWGHAVTTVHRVTCRRTPTKSKYADPRRKHVIRR